MILYDLINGDPYTQKVTYRPRTCFLMTQLGGKVPEEVDRVRRELGRTLDAYDFNLIDANSAITGKDFLSKIWSMIVSVPLAVAVVHEGMPAMTLCNVFYEVGLAQALGKETIVIKTARAEVPSDFVRTEYIEYDSGFEHTLSRFVESVLERSAYYEEMSYLLEQNPLLAIDYLRRSFLISGREECSSRASEIVSALPLEGRARDSVEMMLAEF